MGAYLNMSAYLKFCTITIKRQLAYRVATLTNMAVLAFWIVMRSAILLAIFGTRDQVAGYGRGEILLYVSLSQALIPSLEFMGWYDLIRSIRTGDVILDYCRPVDFFGMWMARDMGRVLCKLFTNSIPLMALFVLVFRLELPGDARRWMLFLASLGLSALLVFTWRFLFNTVAFWTVDAVGIANVAGATGSLLMGLLVPVTFFPPLLQAVSRWTPFPDMLNTPVEIITGMTPLSGASGVLVRQALWTAGMCILARYVARRGLTRVVIQGG